MEVVAFENHLAVLFQTAGNSWGLNPKEAIALGRRLLIAHWWRDDLCKL